MRKGVVRARAARRPVRCPRGLEGNDEEADQAYCSKQHRRLHLRLGLLRPASQHGNATTSSALGSAQFGASGVCATRFGGTRCDPCAPDYRVSFGRREPQVSKSADVGANVDKDNTSIRVPRPRRLKPIANRESSPGVQTDFFDPPTTS